jgi:hypothetical protein
MAGADQGELLCLIIPLSNIFSIWTFISLYQSLKTSMSIYNDKNT